MKVSLIPGDKPPSAFPDRNATQAAPILADPGRLSGMTRDTPLRLLAPRPLLRSLRSPSAAPGIPRIPGMPRPPPRHCATHSGRTAATRLENGPHDVKWAKDIHAYTWRTTERNAMTTRIKMIGRDTGVTRSGCTKKHGAGGP